MEKNDISDTEQEKVEVKPEVESIPAVKPKRKLNLTPEQRAVRAENMRRVSLARIEKSRSLNEIIKKDVDEVKHDVKLKAYKEVKKRVGKIKAKKLNEPEPESDSDESSDDEIFTSSKKKKRKNNQPIIVIKNYSGEPKKKYKDAEELPPSPKQNYKPEPEPVISQPRIPIGYFV